jgi:hypothetical protein
VLARADRDNINIRGALWHAITDAVSSAGVLVSGAVIAMTGFDRIDPLVSIAIAILVLWGSWRLMKSAVSVLLDTAPPGLDADRVAAALLELDGVTEVHDLHVWTLTPGNAALSAHVRIDGTLQHDEALALLAHIAKTQFNITHTTLQLTTDRSGIQIEPVGLLPVSDAIEWAREHLQASNPSLSPSVILAATGAAAVGLGPTEKISPVSLTVRAKALLAHNPEHDSDHDHA